MTGHLMERDTTLTRFPAPAQPDEYEQASNEIESLLERLPGIVAVYRAGTVSVPGISDIDRIAVTERAARVPPVWPSLSSRTKDLAMHGPFLVDLATFRRHRWFAYVEPLELSFGTPIELEDPPLPETSDVLISAESIVISLLSAVKQASTGVFKVRPSLCQLNNLRHALALARLEADDSPEAWQLADDVADLRRDWFELPDPDRNALTRDVAARAVDALLEALGALVGRTECSDEVPRETRLGPPWANVVLTTSGDGRDPVARTPRGRLPFMGSPRAAELRWRAARPRIALPPAVLSLLTGAGRQQENDFRAARDVLVRAYREFLAANGHGYAEIGLASPFLSTEHSR